MCDPVIALNTTYRDPTLSEVSSEKDTAESGDDIETFVQKDKISYINK